MSDRVAGGLFLGREDFENKRFVIHKREKEHFFRALNGIGLNARQLDRLMCLERAGKISVIRVFLHLLDGSILLLNSGPDHWFLHALEYKNPAGIKDLQYVLPLEYFERIE